MRFQDNWWHVYIPSGVSFAIGKPFSLFWEDSIYVNDVNIDSQAYLLRVLGGVFMWAYLRRVPSKRLSIVVLASGMLLGESLGSLGELVLFSVNAPHLG